MPKVHVRLILGLIILAVLVTTCTQTDIIENITNTTKDVEPEPIVENKVCEVYNPLYNVSCDTILTPKYSCDQMMDGDLETEWLAGAGCPDNRLPCVVTNYVDIVADQPFDKIIINNRNGKDFFINRVRLDYNDIIEEDHRGGRDFAEDKPWQINLTENTTSVHVDIVEIMGIGDRYVTGIRELELEGRTC